MAACTSMLAWRIPWTEETGGLQSMGSQRVRLAERLSTPPAVRLNRAPGSRVAIA